MGWGILRIVPFVVPIAACSLLTDLSGLSGGAAEPEGGTPDAAEASIDGGADVDAAIGPFVCPADALFCEDFEGSLAAYSFDNENGSHCDATVDKPHRGAKSLHATAPFDATGFQKGDNQNQCYFNRALPTPLVTTGTLSVRAYLYLAAGEGQSGDWSIPWFRDSPIVNGCHDGSMTIGISEGHWGAIVHNATGYYDVSGATAPVYDRWLCVEWIVDLAANGHLTMLVDGTKVIDDKAPVAQANPFCGYGELSMGIVGHRSSGAVEVYWDDVVVATHPIGCN